jgi:hypothetical protein
MRGISWLAAKTGQLLKKDSAAWSKSHRWKYSCVGRHTRIRRVFIVLDYSCTKRMYCSNVKIGCIRYIIGQSPGSWHSTHGPVWLVGNRDQPDSYVYGQIYFCQKYWWNLNFLCRYSKNTLISHFTTPCPVKADLYCTVRTNRHDKANCHFSQFSDTRLHNSAVGLRYNGQHLLILEVGNHHGRSTARSGN